MNDVLSVCQNIIDQIKETQLNNIAKAAKISADAFADNHKIFVTGSGHSHTFAEELYGRAGGLAFFVPIMTTELTIVEHPTKSTYIERLPGYAPILAELYGLKQNDVVFIASNSGRNAYPIEMALRAKELGCHVIAVTNVKHSSSATPRHSSNKRLMDVADVVIDNCGEIGDAALKVEGVEPLMAPTSSIANSIIATLLSVEIAKLLLNMGIEPPVFTSANVDGGFEKNEAYMRQYTRLYY
jgi:uncharacterized phosphosugar-binding protein